MSAKFPRGGGWGAAGPLSARSLISRLTCRSHRSHRLWVHIRIDSRRLGDAVLTSTHNLCFGAKKKKKKKKKTEKKTEKNNILLETLVLLYKRGVQGGIRFMAMLT